MRMKPTAERREFFRFDLNFSIRYRFAKKLADNKYKTSKLLKGIGINFSACGAAVKITKPLPVDTLVYLEITLPFCDEPLLATSQVIRRDLSSHNDKPVTLIGVKYLVIEEKTKASLASYRPENK